MKGLFKRWDKSGEKSGSKNKPNESHHNQQNSAGSMEEEYDERVNYLHYYSRAALVTLASSIQSSVISYQLVSPLT